MIAKDTKGQFSFHLITDSDSKEPLSLSVHVAFTAVKVTVRNIQ